MMNHWVAHDHTRIIKDHGNHGLFKKHRRVGCFFVSPCDQRAESCLTFRWPWHVQRGRWFWMEFDDGTNIKKSYGIYGVYGHELLITTENKHLSPKISFEDHVRIGCCSWWTVLFLRTAPCNCGGHCWTVADCSSNRNTRHTIWHRRLKN